MTVAGVVVCYDCAWLIKSYGSIVLYCTIWITSKNHDYVFMVVALNVVGITLSR